MSAAEETKPETAAENKEETAVPAAAAVPVAEPSASVAQLEEPEQNGASKNEETPASTTTEPEPPQKVVEDSPEKAETPDETGVKVKEQGSEDQEDDADNDGDASPPDNEENEGPDDDEDAKNPAYIPRKGAFYMHDSRNDDAEGKVEESLKKSRADKRWTHDLFDDRQQRPKSKVELIKKYGYDIRHNDKTEEDGEGEGDEEKPKLRVNRRPRGGFSGRGEERVSEESRGEGPRRPASDRPARERREPQTWRDEQPREPQLRENRRHQNGGAPRGSSSYRGTFPRRGAPQGNHFVNENGHFKRTVVPSNTRSRREDLIARKKDDNHNNVAARRVPPQTNGSTPTRSTPSTPRTNKQFQTQGVRPAAVVSPMPLMAGVAGPFVQPAVVPVVVPLPANYPHPRQPTEAVYFDPNSQSNATRTPPQPREKRTLEIAPPTQ